MKRILLYSVLLFFAAIAAMGGFFLTVKPVDLVDFEYVPSQKSVIYSSDGEIVAEIYEENRTYVKLERIPQQLVTALVDVEDKRFYQHGGYDIQGIARALLTNLKDGKISEGASTITQQLARNLFEEISTEQTLKRKIKEAKTAAALEKIYNKDEIMEMYLNEIYLGGGVYGVQQASLRYFGKNVWELDLAESALIAGLPQAPSGYQPDLYFEKAKKRQEVVLKRMFERNHINEEEYQAAVSQELIIKSQNEFNNSIRFKSGYEDFISHVISEYMVVSGIVEYQKAVDTLKKSGLAIHTTIDTRFQKAGIKALEDLIVEKNWNEIDGALVSVDSNGKIKTYIGGKSEIDLASTPRQPGSTLKPLIYAAALDDGVIEKNSIVLDEKTDFNGYIPKSADGNYYGYVTVRVALTKSLNIPAVKVMNEFGIENTIEHLKTLGFSMLSDDDRGLSTALGGLTYGVSPLEMAAAYTIFLNEGSKVDSYSIDRIIEADKIIYAKKANEDNLTDIISSDTSNYIKDVLINNVFDGTGTKAGNPLITGGKTGTSSDSRDLWFSGFTGKYSTVVWIGNVDSKPVKGSSSQAAGAYGDYMKNLISEDLIDEPDYMYESNKYETERVYVLIDNDEHKESYNENEVTEISILKNEEQLFSDEIVLKVQIDKASNLKHIEGYCPDANKIARFYRPGSEPDDCDRFHLWDFLKVEFR
ncbi:transglycosylase domain-containing protein [Alkalibacter mobilis]|uniref:transglycosylase domain-containing protein n=1 Tax=Alkalibacter mobilis TaxID=2787712 RepID=UPI0018A03E03|nr:transglycosylase domain-containing protein [Alkalibacter mobilis]MBF7096908.1 transglycosylase domain-containing protein [Alkalibacter mobilis]